MLPVRINLPLLIFITLLLSCKTETKDDKVSSGKKIINTQDQLPKYSTVYVKPVSIKKENGKTSTNKNSVARNELVAEKKQLQSFTISSERDTTLNGEEGTVIKIKHESFVYAETNIDVIGPVSVHMAEYYKLSDILLANLTTESNGRMLETGGMIFIEALAEGKQCELKKDSTIEIQFPFTERKEGMQLFIGTWENENVNWEELYVPKDTSLTIEWQAPEYPGGNRPLNSFLSRRIDYFDSMLGFTGTISVKIQMDEAGKINSAEVIEPFLRRYNRIIQNVFFKMPRWKPATQNGVPVKCSVTQTVFFILDEREYPDTAFKKEFEELIDTDTTLLNETSPITISRYIFSSSKLGWINCDRFYDEKGQKLDLFVKAEGYDELEVKLVFHSFKSILSGMLVDNNYRFRQVPIDESITIVAIARKNERNFVAFGDYSTNSRVIDNLVFRQVTKDDLKESLKRLDSIK